MSWNLVYELVKQVPKGRLITYGQLARVIRLRGGARAAGHAMAACPRGQGIPWHRVVGAGGRILLREPRAALQRRLLEGEGIRLRAGRVELAEHEWPMPARRNSQFAIRPRQGSRAAMNVL